MAGRSEKGQRLNVKAAWVIFWCLLCWALLAVWIGGIRIVALSPMESEPNGAFIIVADADHLRLVDSPDNACATWDETCRLLWLWELMEETNVLTTLRPWRPLP